MESASYQVALDVFEGPLDLLLHLVKKHELSILDIPIAFVTEKYLEYLDAMAGLDIDVAGEYLLMAATLCHIKSRELLPTPEAEDDDRRPRVLRLDLLQDLHPAHLGHVVVHHDQRWRVRQRHLHAEAAVGRGDEVHLRQRREHLLHEAQAGGVVVHAQDRRLLAGQPRLQQPHLVTEWKAALFVRHGNPLMMGAMAVILFPKLALGLSGFETGVAVTPRPQP